MVCEHSSDCHLSLRVEHSFLLTSCNLFLSQYLERFLIVLTDPWGNLESSLAFAITWIRDKGTIVLKEKTNRNEVLPHPGAHC
jgi:hypothetical protein